MIAAIALALVLAPDAWQKLAGPAFEAFAARTDAVCPARQLRFVTPSDLDWYQEDFVDRLGRQERHRLARADVGQRRCAGHDGLACPTTATLAAMAEVSVVDRFATFACTAPPPTNATTFDPARTHRLPSTSPYAPPAAGPMR